MVSNFLVQHWFLTIVSLVPCISYASALSFESYKVSEIYSGEHHQLVTVRQVDENWMEGRKKAIQRSINFAGHYVIHTDGCGGGAVCGEILDVKTGEVVESFPNAYYIDGEYGAAPFAAVSKPESRLLIIIGVAADPEVGVVGEEIDQGNRRRYYEFINDKLKLIEVVER
jgi:hypothetical protein